MVKNLPTVWETQDWSLGWEDPLEKGMAKHSSILAWRILWTERTGGLQSMGWQTIGYDWATKTFTFSIKEAWTLTLEESSLEFLSTILSVCWLLNKVICPCSSSLSLDGLAWHAASSTGLDSAARILENSPITLNNTVLSDFLIFANLIDRKWYHFNL